MGNYEKAVENYDIVLDVDPNWSSTQQNRNLAAQGIGAYDGTETYSGIISGSESFGTFSPSPSSPSSPSPTVQTPSTTQSGMTWNELVDKYNDAFSNNDDNAARGHRA